jgi:hypothetical protein
LSAYGSLLSSISDSHSKKSAIENPPWRIVHDRDAECAEGHAKAHRKKTVSELSVLARGISETFVVKKLFQSKSELLCDLSASAVQCFRGRGKEQEKIESEYHRMKPKELDQLMTRAKRYSPPAIRLPAAWIDRLEVMAELEGELGYHTMVRRWIEERLRQESRLALRLSKMSPPTIAAVLKRHALKKTGISDDLR